MEAEIFKYFLPANLLKYFAIKQVNQLEDKDTKSPYLQIQLEEINNIPEGYSPGAYESKGFCKTATIQDFPIRGKTVYLVIKRRRWRHKDNKSEIIANDYSFIADGSKMTQELADFLKGTG